MYRLSFILVMLVVMLFQVNSAQATLDADSVYWFPWTAEPPIIDGEMDPVWYAASNLVLEKLVTGYEVNDWFDIWGKCKMLWDNDNLYIFMTVHDDVNQPEAANSYEQDGVEFFFDGDLSQADAFDGVDDIQLRFNTQWEPGGATYPEAGFGTGTSWEFDRTGVDWAFKFTDLGYNFEGIIPLANLQMEDMYDQVFGFEVQINDNDGDARSAEWKWWSSSGNSWQQPSIWGNAGMSDYYAGEILCIEKAYREPVIDGILDDVWDIAPDFSDHTYVTQTAYVPDDWSIYERVDDWNDMSFDYRVMWDYNYLFFFFNVRDDMISTEAGGDWQKDGIELYFDGDNSKNDYTNDGIPYDDNDRHLRRVFNDSPSVDYACRRTEQGWTMEWKVPYSDLGWEPERDHIIGFDVQLNDQDDPALLRSGAARWWGNDNNASVDASMFGSANLMSSFIPGSQLSVFTFDATDITDTSCRMNGWVHYYSDFYVIKFQYGLTTQYGDEIIAVTNQSTDSLNVMVFADVTGLMPNSTYHYRINVFGDFYSQSGKDKTFTTSPDLPVVHSLSATGINESTAILNGEINTKNISTTVSFQYGRWTDYGKEIPALKSPVNTNELTLINAQLTGLYPNSVYHYRVVTTSAAGTAYGRDMEFTTLEPTDIESTIPLPQQFSLLQNFPNPFNPVTNIVYKIPVSSHVKITVFNLQGELVRTLFTGAQGPGRYPLFWDGADEAGAKVASGLYFLRMDADGFMDMKKIMLIK